MPWRVERARGRVSDAGRSPRVPSPARRAAGAFGGTHARARGAARADAGARPRGAGAHILTIGRPAPALFGTVSSFMATLGRSARREGGAPRGRRGRHPGTRRASDLCPRAQPVCLCPLLGALLRRSLERARASRCCAPFCAFFIFIILPGTKSSIDPSPTRGPPCGVKLGIYVVQYLCCQFPIYIMSVGGLSGPRPSVGGASWPRLTHGPSLFGGAAGGGCARRAPPCAAAPAPGGRRRRRLQSGTGRWQERSPGQHAGG